MELRGQTAIVTGASGALGSEIALCLGRLGMDCVCHYHCNEEAADGTAALIRSMGGGVCKKLTTEATGDTDFKVYRCIRRHQWFH